MQRRGDVLHRATMGEEDSDLIRASIVAVGNSLFIRTDSRLYRISSQE